MNIDFKKGLKISVTIVISLIVLLMIPALGAGAPFVPMILFLYVLPPIVLVFVLYKLLTFIIRKTVGQHLVRNDHFSRKALLFLVCLIVFNTPSILLSIFISNPGCVHGCPEIIILYIPLFILILASFFFAAVASVKIGKELSPDQFNDSEKINF